MDRRRRAILSADTSAVPFLVKLAGKRETLVYDRPFNTVITRRMISAILARRVADNTQIVKLIEE